MLVVAAPEVANREWSWFNVVTGLELDQQRWPLCFCPSRLSLAGTVHVRWISYICFESIGFGLRGLTQLQRMSFLQLFSTWSSCLASLRRSRWRLRLAVAKFFFQLISRGLLICLISDWFAKHIVVKPPHGERPLLSILCRCWNSVPRREWGFWIRRWRQHRIYLLTVCPYFLQNNA